MLLSVCLKWIFLILRMEYRISGRIMAIFLQINYPCLRIFGLGQFLFAHHPIIYNSYLIRTFWNYYFNISSPFAVFFTKLFYNNGWSLIKIWMFYNCQQTRHVHFNFKNIIFHLYDIDIIVLLPLFTTASQSLLRVKLSCCF